MSRTDPQDVGLSADRLQRLPAAIAADVENKLYDGAVVIVGRHGKIVLHEAIGFAEREIARRARVSDIFPLVSITKSLTATMVLSRVERGDFLLTTPVAEIIPEFAANGKGAITFAQLLSHTGGLPAELPRLPLDHLGNLEIAVAHVCGLAPSAPPGAFSYSSFCAHYILAEAVRRVEDGKRRFGQILQDDLFTPLGMADTSLGLRGDLQDRSVPIVSRAAKGEGMFTREAVEGLNKAFAEGSEVPAAGAYSTAADMWRFAEMLRRGGELNGMRILSPAMIRLAATNHTGDMNFDALAYATGTRGWPPFPANFGLGFVVRGDKPFQPAQHGTLASPGAFGHKGAGLTNFWIDPETDLVFVCLTAGLLEETRSWDRWQRLSDFVHAAVVD